LEIRRNNIFFTVGPTQLFPEIESYIKEALELNICSIYHRSDEFIEIYKSVYNSLKSILKLPDGFKVFFLGSATECMDRLIMNLVHKKSCHFINGAFSERFYNTAAELGKKTQIFEAQYGKGFDFDVKIQKDAELICFTQNETSTGVQIPPENIHQVKKDNPDKLVAVDIVSSFPFAELDFKLIDAAFFSVQKGVGMPSGLAVLIVNEKCIEKTNYIKNELKGNIGSYHNFIKLSENARKFQPTETPNTLGIFLLSRVLKRTLDYGIEKIRKEIKEKSKLLYDFLDRCEIAKPFVKNPKDRSDTVITITTEKKAQIMNALKKEGYILSSGYARYRLKQLRMGNYPMHKIEDIKKIISIIKNL
jgi:phosphoserine aminotransferase